MDEQRPETVEGLLVGEMTYKRSYWRINPNRMARIAYIIEQYVSGRSINDIESETGMTGPTIGRYLTIYYFPYRGDNSIILVMRSKIDPPIIKIKIKKERKKVIKPIFWKKPVQKPMPEQCHSDYQLKRKLSLTFNHNNF